MNRSLVCIRFDAIIRCMTKRTTVSLDDADQQTLASFADPTRTEWDTLVESAARHGITLKRGASEATIIRALLRAGAAALREQAMEQGYAQLAEMWPEVHDSDEAAARRRSYAERVDRVTPA